MWFIGVEVEQETSAPPPKKNPGSVPARVTLLVGKKIKIFYFHLLAPDGTKLSSILKIHYGPVAVQSQNTITESK